MSLLNFSPFFNFYLLMIILACMFSDTHFHFKMMADERGLDGAAVLSEMAKKDCFFGLDIGTKADDLKGRQDCVEKAILNIAENGQPELSQKACRFIYFSAGIWPDVDSIKDRFAQVKKLEENILQAQNGFEQTKDLNQKVIAVGECGLDHHWNPSGADGRCESDFDADLFNGEREMFQMQLELGKKMNLPVLVHSRDAFEDSLDCIKNVGYHNGIIHCYSYGIEEARKFLDLGWYIALGGGITYTKKSKLEQMEELIRFIPDDRLLTETDAPYLAPVPFRGQANSPVLVEYVFKYLAQVKNISESVLNSIVDENISKLFGIKR